jgi:hypothetical protein
MNDFEMTPITHVVTYLVITFMHDIYNYIPERNHVSKSYGVAAVVYLKFELI